MTQKTTSDPFARSRFLSEDPTTPRPDQNLYRWCGNNPLNSTDPSGRCPISSGAPSISSLLSGSSNYYQDTGFSLGLGNLYQPSSLSMPQFGQGYQAAQNAAYYQEASRYIDAERRAQTVANAQSGSVAWAGITGFGSGLAQTFSNGQAWDSVQGAGVGILDSGADLLMAGANTVGRAGVDTRSFFTGESLAYPDWQRSGRLSDYVSPLYGNGQSYSQGVMVGDYAVRVDVVAAVGWKGADALVAAPSTIASLYGAGSGMFGSAALGGGSALAFSPSVVGGVATVGVSGTAVVGVGAGLYNSGASEPLRNWFLTAGENAPNTGGGRISNVPGNDFAPDPSIAKPYSRPSGAGPTAAQRAAVQGKPCVECGEVTANQVADHIDPLSVEYYRTGTNDIAHQSSIEAVQSHCPECSNVQGGLLSGFSRYMKKLLGL
jgi:hypothetical protein